MLGRRFAAVVVVLASLVWAGPSMADFSAARRISREGVDAAEPKVAVDPQGNAVLVWTRLDDLFFQCSTSFGGKCRIQARGRSKKGKLGPIVALSDASQHALSPDVAVDKNGNAVFVWLRRDGSFECEGGLSSCYRVQARSRKADGTLGPVRTLSVAGKNAAALDVAMDPNGNAAVIWAREQPGCGGACYVIETRTLRANGTLSANQRLSTFSREPRVAVDANGNAVFAWLRFDPQGRLQTRVRSPDGLLSTVQTLAEGDVLEPQLGVTPGGATVFVWTQQDPVTSCGGTPCTFVLARTRSAAGVLGATQTISGASGREPQIGVDADGDAVVVWRREDSTLQCGGGLTACVRVEARARRADGAFGATEVISDPGEHGSRARVAVDAAGNAVVLWESQFPTVVSQCGPGCFKVKARSRSATGTWSPIKTLSVAGLSATRPHVAADPDGGLKPDAADAVAVWVRTDGHNQFPRVEAAAQIAPAP